MPDEERDAIWERWGAWLEEHGASVVDPGMVFGDRVALAGDGNDQRAPALVSYSIVSAENLDGVRELCARHPFLEGHGADFTVDVYEMIPV